VSLESIEEEIAVFKRANGLHARAELPLYCVTIRELGRRGCGQLADAMARKVTTTTTPSAGGDDVRQQRIYSALLEGYCMRRQGDEAVALYVEMVEKRNLLPSRRAIHMLMELLTRAPRQSPVRAADEEEVESEAKGDASVNSVASDDKCATTTAMTAGRKLKVTELFEEMKARGSATTAAYNAMLSVVGRKERKLPSLKNLLDEMHAHQVPRNEFTWKTLLESARYTHAAHASTPRRPDARARERDG
jgi:pentatricopeptide repeat protein